jgi:cytochrome c biogenesis protein CcmG, thiol:disulfide interchange protein DsbE
MMIRLRFVLPLAVFILIVCFFWRGLGKDPNLLPSILIGHPLPSFTAPSLENNATMTHRIFNGKTILLNVWASWCAACQLEHPLLMDIAKKEGVQLYGMNYKDERQAAKKYLAIMGNPYRQVLYDARGDYAMLLGVYGTPETFLIDKKGIVRFRYVGPITLDILEKDLLPRINKLQREN